LKAGQTFSFRLLSFFQPEKSFSPMAGAEIEYVPSNRLTPYPVNIDAGENQLSAGILTNPGFDPADPETWHMRRPPAHPWRWAL
jgi:hypothetical protein